jgi:hypothetical protein
MNNRSQLRLLSAFGGVTHSNTILCQVMMDWAALGALMHHSAAYEAPDTFASFCSSTPSSRQLY